MFVRSNMDIPVRYSKSSGSVILKPNTVTFVEETIVTAKELKDCYGDRITILSDDVVEQIIEEDKKAEQDLEIADTPDEANTGDEAVDNFLNGKTDEVPEGTEEITEEEALKLKAQADAEAKAKEEAEKLEALKAKEAAEKAKAAEEAKKSAPKAKTETKKASAKKSNKK